MTLNTIKVPFFANLKSYLKLLFITTPKLNSIKENNKPYSLYDFCCDFNKPIEWTP